MKLNFKLHLIINEVKKWESLEIESCDLINRWQWNIDKQCISHNWKKWEIFN